jgi:hypothetical protein
MTHSEHDMGPMTTAMAKSSQRMKEDVSMKKKKRAMIKAMIKKC